MRWLRIAGPTHGVIILFSVQAQLAMHSIEITSFPPEFVPGRDEYIGPQFAAKGFTLVDKARQEFVLSTVPVQVRGCVIVRCPRERHCTASCSVPKLHGAMAA